MKPLRRRRSTRDPGVDPMQNLWAKLGIPGDYAARRGLPMQREARRLIPIGRHCRLAPGAARAWQAMQSAAREDGVTLILLSGFRSVRRQATVIRRKLAQGQRLQAILRSVAPPGCSEHHTGCAIDLGDDTAPPLDRRFARTKAFRWLVRNASRFGFRLSYPRRNPQGFVFEPWHWRWAR